MKIYIDFDKLKITKIVQDVMYKGDVLSNAFELLFYNCSDTSWYPTMSQLAPNDRQAGDFAADALEEGESQTVIEDDITYLRYKFTIGAGWVLVTGKSEFFIWKNTVTPMTRKCIGKVVVTLNESTETYFIDDVEFNPKIRNYIESVASDIEDELNDKVDAQNATIASLSQASPSVFDTAANIQLLQENKGVAVATDTGYIWHWDSTLTTPAYVSSGLQYNSLANYTKHSGSQLQDANGNNIIPNTKASNVYGLSVVDNEIGNAGTKTFDLSSLNGEQGGISANGTPATATNRCRFSFIVLPVGATINIIDNNYLMNVCVYSYGVLSSSYMIYNSNAWETTKTIANYGYVAIALKKSDNSDFNINNITLSNILSITYANKGITGVKVSNASLGKEKIDLGFVDLTKVKFYQSAIAYDGGLSDSTTRVTLNIGYFDAKTVLSVVNFNYSINVAVYSAGVFNQATLIENFNSYANFHSTNYSGYILIALRKNDNSNISISDVNTIINNIVKVKQPKVYELSNDYIERNCKARDKYFHFSLDDFYSAFLDITTNASTYTSIYNNSTFAFLKQMHDTYGCVFSCYCYLDVVSDNYSIENVTNKFKQDFIDAKDWLKFGFHALNSGTNLENETYANAQTYYNRFVSAILNITGTTECIDIMPRLHNFAGSENSLLGLRDCKCGIVGALGADDTRQSYYLSSANYGYLFAHEKLYDATNYLTFVTTDIRLERDGITDFYTLDSNVDFGSKIKQLIVFTHEWALSSQKSNILFSINWAYFNGYDFDYPQNRN